MSFRDRIENFVIRTEADLADIKARCMEKVQIGDVIQICHPATKVDLRLFAQLRESLGCPYPDDPVQ